MTSVKIEICSKFSDVVRISCDSKSSSKQSCSKLFSSDGRARGGQRGYIHTTGKQTNIFLAIIFEMCDLFAPAKISV